MDKQGGAYPKDNQDINPGDRQLKSGDIILELVNISKSFPGVKALQNVNFQLRKGEVHVLLGENGAGKSTLVKVITGAYIPDEGQIFLRGQETKISGSIFAQNLGISAVYQEFNLIPYLDAVTNIFLGKEVTMGKVIKFLDKRTMYKKSMEVLERVGAKVNPGIPVNQLGVASQQLIEIAKALISEAEILILDEPTAVLTEEEISRLFEVIRMLTAQGVGIIYISHRLEEISQIGDRVTVMRDGEYITTVEVENKTIDIDYLIQLMVGRKLGDKFPKEIIEPGKEMLRVENLCRKGALKNINFNLKAGEILGIAGLVGAGRTELAKAVFGADPIDGGDIYIEGQKVTIKSPRDAIALKIGLVPEDRKSEGLVLMMPVDANIVMASMDRVCHQGIISFSALKSIASNLVNALRVATPGLKQKVENLSGGNQQKIVLAKWLASQSKIIIFDEPTRGIDVGAKIEAYQLMNELVKHGVGIIMISSELPELLAMSDRILVMHEGQISGELSRDEATQEKILYYAAGGVKNVNFK